MKISLDYLFPYNELQKDLQFDLLLENVRHDIGLNFRMHCYECVILKPSLKEDNLLNKTKNTDQAK